MAFEEQRIRVSALIPVRKGSVRIPNKNLQQIGSLTLVGRKILQLQQSKYITEVIVGTNCPQTTEIARGLGAKVLPRDEFVCDEGRASANDMIGDLVRRVDTDVVVWAHCTNPFVYGRHYDDAIEKFLESESRGYDSLLSLYRVQTHLWNQFGFPSNYNPYAPRHTLARDIPPMFGQDGAIFIQRHRDIIVNSYFFGRVPLSFEIEFPYSHDVNTPVDLDIARLMVDYVDNIEQFGDCDVAIK